MCQINPVILIGGYGCELCFGEDKCSEVFARFHVFPFIRYIHNMKPRLVSMHRIQYYLCNSVIISITI